MEGNEAGGNAFLTEDQEALLHLLLEEEGISPIEEIGQRNVSRDAPLSFQQQSLWLFDQLIPRNPAYNITVALLLRGILNLEALKQSLDTLVDRHESLRTIFVTVAEQTVQRVLPSVAIPFSLLDLDGIAEQEQEAVLVRLAKDEMLLPFSLVHGPLLRATVIRQNEHTHVFLLTLHHIISDAWSQEILFAELTALYDGYVRGLPVSLPTLPIHYADFAIWQQEQLQGVRLERLLTYWRDQLVDAPTLTSLPGDLPRPASQTFTGARYPIELSPSLLAALKSLCLQEDCTLFMLLLAAVYVLLYRYSGQKDQIIGTAIANRNRLETERVIGYFVNMLPLRTRISEAVSFLTFLRQVREVTLDAYRHQDLPFQLMVQELQWPRDPGLMPVFQVVLTLQNAIVAPTCDFPDLQMRPQLEIEQSNPTTKYDLTMSLSETENGVQGELEYTTALFEEETIAHVLQHFHVLLQSIVSNPLQRLDELPLIRPGERVQLLACWDRTRPAASRFSGVHQIFEQWAERQPDAVAVSFEETYLTYQALNQLANQLAHSLRQLGVSTERCVGICLPHSLELPAGMLGILKAGGAYVPLDPAYPQERLDFMLDDLGITVVITLDRWSSVFRTHTLCLDRDGDLIASMGHENLEGDIHEEQLAYVNYTSGSTGLPKGVGIPHRSVVRLVCSPNYLELSCSDRLSQASNVSFDACTFELWGALLNGACLVEIPQDVLLAPHQFAREVRRKQLTTVFVTTALLNLFAREIPGAFQSVPHVLFGGEAVDLNAVRVILREGAPQRLIHAYGPTENTTFTLCYHIQSIEQEKRTLPIGQPISGDRVYILDQRGAPVPVGVPGELYIGGNGLARGYLNRPDLTADRFIPDPFSGEPGARLYRTGDIVRSRFDTNLEFVGRADQQVKLRGYRIEPGEIEHVLVQHPGVRACVLMSRDDQGEKFLAAYLIPNEGEAPSPVDLRHFLAERLPEYMIPSTFTWLETIPFTPYGKVNYRALPIPEGGQTQPEKNYSAPRDILEERLAHMWGDVLEMYPVGVKDDFFALGGHSFLAIRLMERLEREFGISLPVSLLFHEGTVEHVAMVLRQQEHISLRSAIVPIQPSGTRPPFFCLHPVSGEVFIYRHLVPYLDIQQPVYGVQDLEMHEAEVTYRSLEELAARSIEALSVAQPDGPYFLGGWSFGGILAFEVARQLQRQGEEIGLLAIFDAVAPSPAGIPNEVDDIYLLSVLVLELTRAFTPLNHQELYQELRGLDREAQLLHALALMQQAGRTLPLDGKRWLSQLHALFHVRMKAVYAYQAQPFSFPMMLFRASEKDEAVDASIQQNASKDLGWGGLARRPVEVYEVPGYHDTMLVEPNVGIVGRQLQQCLEKMQRSL